MVMWETAHCINSQIQTNTLCMSFFPVHQLRFKNSLLAGFNVILSFFIDDTVQGILISHEISMRLFVQR